MTNAKITAKASMLPYVAAAAAYPSPRHHETENNTSYKQAASLHQSKAKET